VTVYDKINFKGNSMKICKSADFTYTAFNDKIASFLLEQMPMAIFLKIQIMEVISLDSQIQQ